MNIILVTKDSDRNSFDVGKGVRDDVKTACVIRLQDQDSDLLLPSTPYQSAISAKEIVILWIETARY